MNGKTCFVFFLVVLLCSVSWYPKSPKGKWRKTSLGTWTKCHAQLWPEIKPPDLLPPLSKQTEHAKGQRAQGVHGHFHEATLPTSYVWACLVSQSSAAKKDATKRKFAASAFHELLQAIFQTGMVDIQLQRDSSTDLVRVPASGMLPGQLLLGHLPRQQLQKLETAWIHDCQE